jgi:hypothetical protein
MSSRGWLGVLLLGGIALRAGLWFSYEPLSYPDTPGYMRVAQNLRSGDFSAYDGRRPPGYPAVLALAGGDPRAVWALQMLAGIGITSLLFFIVLSATGRPGLATALAMTYNLNLAQLFFEANLLSETIGTLLVVAVVAGVVIARHRLGERDGLRWVLLSLGILAGAAVLTKPQFIFLPLLLGALVAVSGRFRFRPMLGRASLAALPGIFLILAWCSFNYARLGYFTLSTQVGIGLMNQSLAFIELAPDRYGTIRDIYLKHRDAKLARTGLHTANWDAVPELLTTTGLSLPALSRELTALSVDLFLHHPIRYGLGVAHGWVDFWMVPIYWAPNKLAPPSLAVPLALLWRIEHALLRLANVAFLLMSALALASRRFRSRVAYDLPLAAISAVVLAASLIQALGEYGENARYAVPVQALVVVGVTLAARRWFEAVGSTIIAQPRVTSPHPHTEAAR